MKIYKHYIRLEIALVLILFFTRCDDSTQDTTPKTLHTENSTLYINDEAFFPMGIYFWPDISSPAGRDPFEDIAKYGLNTLVAYYEYVRQSNHP